MFALMFQLVCQEFKNKVTKKKFSLHKELPGFPVIRYCKEIQKNILQIKNAAIPQISLKSTHLICSPCIILGRPMISLIQEVSLRREINEQNCQS